MLEIHKINLKEKRTKLIRDAIKTINTLTQIYTNPDALFDASKQKKARDMLVDLGKNKSHNGIKNSIHNQLITEVETLIKKIKYVQIWKVIRKIKKYIHQRLEITSAESNAEVKNIQIKRRIW